MAKRIIEYDNLCVGCETCVNCGRNKDFPVWEYECDSCGEFDTELEIYSYNDLELCKECLLYEWLKNHSLSQIFNKLLEYEFEDILKQEFKKVEDE